jgi:Leucine-rich repeat (LRR) protein
MKTSCQIIEDLLPLYIDEVCSEESKAVVEDHLKNCQSCRAKYDSQMGDVIVSNSIIKENLKAKRPFKKIKGSVIKLSIVILILSLIFGSTVRYYIDELNYNKIVGFQDIGLLSYLIELNNIDYVKDHETGSGYFPNQESLKYSPRNQAFIRKGYLKNFVRLNLEVEPLLLHENIDKEELTDLIEAFNKIDTLDDITHFKALNTLTINGSNIKDITPLSKLKYLEFLYLSQTNIQDVSSINNIQNLKRLDLRNNKNIKDLSISNSSNFLSLSIDNTAFRNFDMTINLDNLVNFDGVRAQGVSFSSIKLNKLPSLRILQLSSLGPINIDEDIIMSSGSNKIEKLEVRGSNNIKTLDFLRHQPTMEELWLEESKVSKVKLSSDVKNPNMWILSIKDSSVEKVEGLENLPNLKHLNLSNNNIEDMGFLFDENDNLILDLISLELSNNKIPAWQIEKYEPILKQHFGSDFAIGEQSNI